jgi:Spy/CpxP family protein refolding chaperone
MDDDSIHVRLLTMETVQKDLGLRDDQIEKIRDCVRIARELYRDFPAKSRELLSPSRHFTPEEAEKAEARWKREFRALSEDLNRKSKVLQTKVLAMLTPSQRERLKQIQLQAVVPAALTRPEIVKALDISEEQRGRIRALRDRTAEKRLAKWSEIDRLRPQERRQKLTEFVKESDKAQAELKRLVLDVLTPEQRAKFQELQGKKIDVTWPYDAPIPY